MPIPSNWSSPFQLFSQALICISHPSHVCYMSCPYLPPWICHPNSLHWRIQFHNKAFMTWIQSHKSTFINDHNAISSVSWSINVPSGWQTVQFTSHCAILNTQLHEITEENCDLKRDSNSLVDCLHAEVIKVTSTYALQGRIASRHMLDMIMVVALLTRIKSSLAIYAACNVPHFSIKTIQKKRWCNSLQNTTARPSGTDD